jgi:hypothetical protein
MFGLGATPKPKAKAAWSKFHTPGAGVGDLDDDDFDGDDDDRQLSFGQQGTRLAVTITSASNLPKKSALSSNDCFVVVEQVTDERGFLKKTELKEPYSSITTRVIDESNNPIWDHRAMFEDYEPPTEKDESGTSWLNGTWLKFTVFDESGKGKNLKKDEIGSYILSPDEFYPDGFDGELELEIATRSQKQKSTLKVAIYTIAPLDFVREQRRALKDNAKGVPVIDPNDPLETLDIDMPKDPYTEELAMRRQRDPFIQEIIKDAGQSKMKEGMTGDEWRLAQAVIRLQRWFRSISFNWLSNRMPVKLPASTEDAPEYVPTALSEPPPRRGQQLRGMTSTVGKDLTWHGRLCASASAVKAAAASSASKRCSAQLQHLAEVGRFVAACRACSVLAIHSVCLDPHGTYAADQAFTVKEEEIRDKLPRRITRDDPLWPHVRGRFDGDRVFVQDSIVLTVLGGDVAGIDQETAWRIYQHDMSGLQAIADVLHTLETLNPIAPPFGVFVDYLGFRVLCRPQVLFVGSKPPELVIGPVNEASKAHGAPGDFPEMMRLALSMNRTEVSTLVNSWEESHRDLRYDLESISANLRVQGLPVTLDSSDLPQPCESTALIRVGGMLHFRTACELLPPEVLTDAGLADPTRRIRREAVEALGAPPLPSRHRLSSINQGNTGTQILAFSAYATREVPRRFLERIEMEGHPLDSRGWTEALHAAGVNCRHIGVVASKASPPVAAALIREGIARAVKWIWRSILWTRLPWAFLATQSTFDAAVGPDTIAAKELIKILNLVLGGGEEAYQFWDKKVVPETVRRFGIAASAVEKQRIFSGGLFLALQYHLKVKFKASASRKEFFNPGLLEPLNVEDLVQFRSMAASSFFPHLTAVQERLRLLQTRYGVIRTSPIQLRGFVPEARVICARGPEWHLACTSPARHVKDGRWDRAYEALNLRLSMSRAIGDPSPVVGAALQGLAVSLIKLAKSAEPEGSMQALHLPQTAAQIVSEAGENFIVKGPHKFSKLADPDKAVHAMWAADQL